MPARFHPHTNLHSLCRQVTVEFLRFLAVLQSPLLQFPSLGIYKSNLLKARVIIASYNDHVRLLSPERSWLVGNHQSLLGYRSRHCHGINSAHNPIGPPSGCRGLGRTLTSKSPYRKCPGGTQSGPRGYTAPAHLSI